MNLADLHRKLSQNASYRTAYAKIGDNVILALHFQAARLAARLTRGDLAKATQLSTRHIAAIEDSFDFRDETALSLIADRLEGHLIEVGVNPGHFFRSGARLADLSTHPPKKNREYTGFVGETPSAPNLRQFAKLRYEAVPEEQIAVLRRVMTGETSPRDAVRALIDLGVVQPRAEHLLSLIDK